MSWLDDFYSKQNKYFADMIAAYYAGKLNESVAPYIRWKEGKGILSKNEGYSVMTFVSEELAKMYESDVIDEKVRDFYEYIDEEVSNLLTAGVLI